MRAVNVLVVALAVVPVMCSLASPAWADKKQARGHTVSEGYQLQLLADRNRDGKINDQKDEQTQNFYSDQTLPSRPYVFWINNDYDVVNVSGSVVFDRKFCSETPPDNNNEEEDNQFKQKCEQWDQSPDDYSNTSEKIDIGPQLRSNVDYPALRRIESTRDLEDFAPLKLRMEGLTALYERYRQHDSRQLVLRMRAVNVGVNLFHGLWNDAGEDQTAHSYVYDYGQQAAQVGYDLYFAHLKKNEDWQSFNLDDDWFGQRFDRERDELRFIFEGVSASAAQCHAQENDGEITIDSSKCYIEAELVLQYKDSEKIAKPLASTRLYLDLHDVKDFYDHYTAGNIENDEELKSFDPEAPEAIRPEYERKQDLFYGITPSEVIEQDYVMLVHGWRMKKQEKIGFGETAFKRLYWSGYQGRFGMLSWPTGWFDKPAHVYTELFIIHKVAGNTQNYNKSEIAARQTGMKLLDFMPDLENKNPNANIHMVAHSMGNVVVSEMLRNATPNIVASYSASQSAEASGGYVNSYSVGQSANEADAFDQEKLLVQHNLKVTCAPYAGQVKKAEFSWQCYNIDEKSPYDMPHDRYQFPGTPMDHGPSIGDHYEPHLTSMPYYVSAVNQSNGFDGLNYVNFYNADDAALTAWEFNQLTKPDYTDKLGGDAGWDYANSATEFLQNLSWRPGDGPVNSDDFSDYTSIMEGTWHENHAMNRRYLNNGEVPWAPYKPEFNLDNARILAHVIPARTKPAGHVPNVFLNTDFRNLASVRGTRWEFRDSNQGHSAQFYSSYAVQKVYWRQILELSLGYLPDNPALSRLNPEEQQP